jgi:Laminin G domain
VWIWTKFSARIYASRKPEDIRMTPHFLTVNSRRSAIFAVTLLVIVSGHSVLAKINSATPPPEEGAVVTAQENGGQVASSYLWHKDRDDQKVALWLPDGVPTIKGVLVVLDRADAAWSPHLQEVARAQGWGVYAMLIRWDNYHETIPKQLARLGKALGHDYLDNVPLALYGGSRNVMALVNFVSELNDPGRILLLLSNGSPGEPPGLKLPAIFKSLPVISVYGSDDPFVEGGVKWMKEQYAKTRQAGFPHTGAVEWGTGHEPRWNFRLYWPFIQAVTKVRYPADADPRKAKVQLLPFPEEKGWLVGPVDWENQWGAESAAFTAYKGDKSQAVWLPDESCVAAWRQVVSKDKPTPFEISGKEIDQPASQLAAKRSAESDKVIQLAPAARQALEHLVARIASAGKSDWITVFRDRFDAKALDPRWSVYEDSKGPKGSIRLAGGVLELTAEANKQAIAMLGYDWPEDVAVEARLRSASPEICDMSIVLGGNRGKSAFPWREGTMFSFGGHFNKGSFIMALEQPDKNWETADCGARITPGEWHTVRFEREGLVLRAAVDGRQVTERTLTDDEAIQLKHHRIGFYTFSSTIQIGGVTVMVKPSGAAGPLPDASAMDALATGLLEQSVAKPKEQRDAARWLIGRFARDLSPALLRVSAKDPARFGWVREELESLAPTQPLS